MAGTAAGSSEGAACTDLEGGDGAVLPARLDFVPGGDLLGQDELFDGDAVGEEVLGGLSMWGHDYGGILEDGVEDLLHGGFDELDGVAPYDLEALAVDLFGGVGSEIRAVEEAAVALLVEEEEGAETLFELSRLGAGRGRRGPARRPRARKASRTSPGSVRMSRSGQRFQKTPSVSP